MICWYLEKEGHQQLYQSNYIIDNISTPIKSKKSSGVKYLCKNTLKYNLSIFWGYLYFTIYIWQLLLYNIPIENNVLVTPYIFVQFTHLSRDHPYCLWSGRLIKHTCLVCKLCWSVLVDIRTCIYKKNKKMVPSCLLNIKEFEIIYTCAFNT
jgi:hypothetical protein